MTIMPVHLSVGGNRSFAQQAPIDGSGLLVVPAGPEHLDAIVRLVDYWARQGENLPRSGDEILASIDTFAVAVYDGAVVGCASLHVYGPRLAEIRSLGVDPSRHGLGIGSALVEHFAERAANLQIPRVFVLTRAPKFFQRNGFTIVSIDLLPEKVFKDCVKCAKRCNCDEIAMIRDLA